MTNQEQIRSHARERMRQKRADDTEFRAKQLEATRRWREANRDKHRNGAKDWASKNPEKKKANQKKYGSTDHGREKKRLAQQRVRARQKLQKEYESFMANLAIETLSLKAELGDLASFVDIVGRSFPKATQGRAA